MNFPFDVDIFFVNVQRIEDWMTIFLNSLWNDFVIKINMILLH